MVPDPNKSAVHQWTGWPRPFCKVCNIQDIVSVCSETHPEGCLCRNPDCPPTREEIEVHHKKLNIHKPVQDPIKNPCGEVTFGTANNVYYPVRRSSLMSNYTIQATSTDAIATSITKYPYVKGLTGMSIPSYRKANANTEIITVQAVDVNPQNMTVRVQSHCSAHGFILTQFTDTVLRGDPAFIIQHICCPDCGAGR